MKLLDNNELGHVISFFLILSLSLILSTLILFSNSNTSEAEVDFGSENNINTIYYSTDSYYGNDYLPSSINLNSPTPTRTYAPGEVFDFQIASLTNSCLNTDNWYIFTLGKSDWFQSLSTTGLSDHLIPDRDNNDWDNYSWWNGNSPVVLNTNNYDSNFFAVGSSGYIAPSVPGTYRFYFYLFSTDYGIYRLVYTTITVVDDSYVCNPFYDQNSCSCGDDDVIFVPDTSDCLCNDSYTEDGSFCVVTQDYIPDSMICCCYEGRSCTGTSADDPPCEDWEMEDCPGHDYECACGDGQEEQISCYVTEEEIPDSYSCSCGNSYYIIDPDSYDCPCCAGGLAAACGSLNDGVYTGSDLNDLASANPTELCAIGSIETIELETVPDPDVWTWGCVGEDDSIACSASTEENSVENGQCNSIYDGGSAEFFPATDLLCTGGYVANVDNTNWTWDCLGDPSGTNDLGCSLTEIDGGSGGGIGPTITDLKMIPSAVNDASNSCTLSWTAEDTDSSFACTVSNGTTDLETFNYNIGEYSGSKEVSPKNTYHVTCTDSTNTTTSIYLNCNLVPNIIEF